MKHILTILLLAGLTALGADITPGYTFANGEQNVTHSKLNSSAAGTINTTFFSGKTAKSVPADGDYFLMLDNAASPSAYKRIAWAGIRSNLLHEAWSSNTVDTADWLLLYDGSSYYKGLASQLVTNAYPTVTSNTLPYTGSTFLVALVSNQWVKVGVTNVAWESKVNFTNLSEQSSPTNSVKFLVSDGNSNSVMSATNLVGGWAANTNLAGTDLALIYSSGSNALAKVTLANLKQYMTNGISSTPQKAIFTNSVPASSAAFTNAHSFAAMPTSVQLYLRCTNAEAGFAVGEELAAGNIMQIGGYPSFYTVKTITNIVVYRSSEANLGVMERGGGAGNNLTAANWLLITYATYIP